MMTTASVQAQTTAESERASRRAILEARLAAATAHDPDAEWQTLSRRIRS